VASAFRRKITAIARLPPEGASHQGCREICTARALGGNVRPVRARLALLVAFVILGVHLDAHRLDEYLQATRVAIERDRVTVEIDLTPGASLAAKVVGWMDTNGDGQLSSNEHAAYAQQVIESVTLSLDGQPGRLTLIDSVFPQPGEIAEGTGTVRLRATAKMSNVASGRHVLMISNAHHPETSVYLVNALVPADHRITIASQRRDPAQQALTLEYDVLYGAWPLVLLIALTATILALRSGIPYRLFRERAGRREAMRASAPSSRA
jgi:hypothetical protein